MRQAERTKGLSPYSKSTARGKPVRMHMNENQTGSRGTLTLTPGETSLYPEEEPLTRQLEEAWQLREGSLMLFNGASEAIMCAALALVNENDSVVTVKPEFTLIPHYLTLAGAKLIQVPMQNRKFQMNEIEENAKKSRMVFISVPHNPTGATISGKEISSWCEACPNTLFVIDEAYASYAECSLAQQAGITNNLIVIRSFSKDHAMAGLRLGAAIGPNEAIQAMAKVRTPYSINAAALKAGKRLKTRPRIEETKEEVKRLAAATEQAGLETITGGGNFFLITGGKSKSFAGFCERNQVLLRTLPDGTVRVSPATQRGNARYLKLLEEWREECKS